MGFDFGKPALIKTYKIDLLTQEYEKSLISTEETINSDFTRFNTIVTSLKYFDPEYSSKNHVRKFLHALPLKWRAKVTTFDEAKDLGTFPLDEIIGDLKVYEMVLDNDGVDSKTTKENVKSLALKAKVTKEQTSDDSDSQGGSNEDMDEEEEAEVLNLMAMNFAISTACFTQNRSLIHKRYNNTPYELLRERKPNMEYFHVSGSLCYQTNDREDLGKMKPKADIGIFIGYSESFRGFQIYNRRTRKIMETIHVKFNELIAMEYFGKRSSKVSINSDAQTTLQDTSSSSLIIVEDNEAPPLVSSSKEQIFNEADEFIQEEDFASLDENALLSSYHTLLFEEDESSSTAEDPSNMQVTTLVQPLTHVCTKAHPLDQVIDDSSRSVMIKSRIIADSKVCMYALTISTIDPKNIKEAIQSQYVIELLKKHGMDQCDSMSTPMATARLDVDLQGTPTDQTKYHSMIKGLMYLTANRPDIAFATFLCVLYEARPMVNHLKEEDGSKYKFKFFLGTKELTMTVADFRRIFQLPQATDNNNDGFVAAPTFSQMDPFFLKDLGLYYSLTHLTTLIPYPRFPKMIFTHYITEHPNISRRVQDNYHRVENDNLVKNIFNYGENKEGAGMMIPEWMVKKHMVNEELDQLLEGTENVDVDEFMDDILNSQEDPHIRIEPRSDKESPRRRRKVLTWQLSIMPRRKSITTRVLQLVRRS
uniref:Retrovirus-related Pol polyprotein from transposon TNT 1-94 n=1 Tax=Tanacetum cinerariifolium TaxID=118510 RepID=A0A699H6J4_TANCI|nr:retrovirus-related Pol polyprotein from transposon TNT 1-94 [Tanacetum cinerariifolium]